MNVHLKLPASHDERGSTDRSKRFSFASFASFAVNAFCITQE